MDISRRCRLRDERQRYLSRAGRKDAIAGRVASGRNQRETAAAPGRPSRLGLPSVHPLCRGVRCVHQGGARRGARLPAGSSQALEGHAGIFHGSPRDFCVSDDTGREVGRFSNIGMFVASGTACASCQSKHLFFALCLCIGYVHNTEGLRCLLTISATPACGGGDAHTKMVSP